MSVFLRQKFLTRNLSKKGIINRKTIAVLTAVVFVVWVILFFLRSPLETSKEVLIQEGQSVYAIADVLKEKGIINNKFTFVVYTLATGNEKKLQAGRYIFEPGATIPKIVNSLASGLAESEDIIITIPEGFNVFDIDKRLTSLGLIKEGEFAKKYYTDEGYFFPDTYRLNRETCNMKHEICIEEIGQKMLKNFNNKVGGISKTSLVIASMLEKEAKKEEDMRLVAGIIRNRLERGIFLQVDATVTYGACLGKLKSLKVSKFKYCDVSQIGIADEIKIDGPYNTYTRAGLPPGPIANPGLKAVRAALDSADTDYLYYLSTRDGDRIIYSKTAAEHAANRKKYLGI